jgi:hypothetical protein
VRLNEYHCGEIYNPEFANSPSSPLFVRCLQSVQRHLPPLLAQRSFRLESVLVYELTDQPAQPTPENHFGVMYDLDHPKPQLALFSAYAGGAVSPDERNELVALGVTPP